MRQTYDQLPSDLIQVCDAPAERDSYDERVDYGSNVYGGCLEPGSRLESRTCASECPECGRWTCAYRTWEAAEGGSLNTYYSYSCDACGHYETDWSEP